MQRSLTTRANWILAFRKRTKEKSGAEQELQIAAIGPCHVNPASITEHQAATHVPESAFDAPQRTIDVHRSQASGAQVLERMDLGSSSGAVPLRADARRLDVGISSGTLGWVEVKATTRHPAELTQRCTYKVTPRLRCSPVTREISLTMRANIPFLGQVSVGVGTGDSAQRQSHSTDTRDGNGPRPEERRKPWQIPSTRIIRRCSVVDQRTSLKETGESGLGRRRDAHSGSIPTPMTAPSNANDSTDNNSQNGNDHRERLSYAPGDRVEKPGPHCEYDPNAYVDQLVQVNSLQQLIQINQNTDAPGHH